MCFCALLTLLKFSAHNEHVKRVKDRLIECQLCHRLIVCARTNIVVHLRERHKTSLSAYASKFQVNKGGKLNTNEDSMALMDERPWYEQCTYQCLLCHAYFRSYLSTVYHVKNSHDIDKVANGFKRVKVVYMTCKLCERSILCTAERIQTHLKRVHKMTRNKYEQMFHQNETEEEEVDVMTDF